VAYTAPADLGLSALLSEVPFTLHQSPYYDETAARTRWHVPESHYLESWSDIRAYDGTVSIVQPLIVPLYQSKSPHELLSAMLGNPTRTNHDLVLEYWRKERPESEFDAFWNGVLRDGVIPNTQSAPISIGANAQIGDAPAQPSGMEINFRPDPSIYDGRWANNGWLQELPKPLTMMVWDNAALMSAATAASLGVANEDVVAIDSGGRTVEAAVWILPGHADQSITLHLGYGRSRAGTVGSDRGFNAYAIRTSQSPWTATATGVRKVDRRYQLVTTQKHFELNGRPIVRHGTQEAFRSEPTFAQEMAHVPAADQTLYPPWENIDYGWGMAIDLSTCVGCNACVVACQAENNIPVVGKDEVANSREMHWIRIDTYREGDPGNPAVFFEPMLCQHCENAPCEVVCPVEATSHSSEGLNEMTYNRCVGTRYCSNNCPYKVRRFNFLQYANWDIPQLKLLNNPDVTVRSRGVMEKCTYCVQRINRARIDAKKKIRDGEVVTACQAACPAEAIVFGNILDSTSQVSRVKSDPRNYGVLAELNTRPRTTYLAKITNPNPEIGQA
jgi:Fe-S-cluster-containing dehydrogenase component